MKYFCRDSSRIPVDIFSGITKLTFGHFRETGGEILRGIISKTTETMTAGIPRKLRRYKTRWKLIKESYKVPWKNPWRNSLRNFRINKSQKVFPRAFQWELHQDPLSELPNAFWRNPKNNFWRH